MKELLMEKCEKLLADFRLNNQITADDNERLFDFLVDSFLDGKEPTLATMADFLSAN
jgi:hypothetical protein